MTLFPFFEDIENKTFLVVGGGKIAKHKVEKLKMFTDNISVIADNTDIKNACLRSFRDDDIYSADYVIAATDDKELNEHISLLCREKNIPVNVVDSPSLCTFIFPSLIKRGDLTVGISSGGKSPAFSKYVRESVEDVIPDNADEIINELYSYREELKKTVKDQNERSKLLKKRLAELL